jgi:hypothetical protein
MGLVDRRMKEEPEHNDEVRSDIEQTVGTIQASDTLCMEDVVGYMHSLGTNRHVEFQTADGQLFQVTRPPAPDAKAPFKGATIREIVCTANADEVSWSWTSEPDNGIIGAFKRTTTNDLPRACAAPPAEVLRYHPVYIAQLDPQRIGFSEAAKVRFEEDKSYPYLPVEEEYCSECQVTWMKGFDSDQYGIHPYHNTLRPDDAQDNVRDERTIVVHVASHGHGTKEGGKLATVGYAVYFGPGSKYNQAGVAHALNAKTNPEIGELWANLMAVVKIAEFQDSWQNQIKSHEQGRRIAHLFKLGPEPKRNGTGQESGVRNDDRDPEKEEEEGPNGEEHDVPSQSKAKNAKKNKGKAGKKKRQVSSDHKNRPSSPKPATRRAPELQGPPCGVQPGRDIRLVITTDSTSSFSLMRDTLREWVYLDEARKFVHETKKPKSGSVRTNVIFADVYEALRDLTGRKIDRDGSVIPRDEAVPSIDVNWYKVPIDANGEAKKMAIDAFDAGRAVPVGAQEE